MENEKYPRDRLTVAFVPGVTPAKWARRWQERHPDYPLVLLPCSEKEQTGIVRDGRAQMSFVRLPVERHGFHLIPLYTEQPVVVAPKGHEIGLFETVPVAELADENLLQDPAEHPQFQEEADDLQPVTGPAPPEAGDAGHLLDLVAAGAGIIILPLSVARLHNRNDVVYRPLTGMEGSTIGLLWPEDAQSDVLEEFIGVVRGRTANSSRQPLRRPESGQGKPTAGSEPGMADAKRAAAGEAAKNGSRNTARNQPRVSSGRTPGGRKRGGRPRRGRR